MARFTFALPGRSKKSPAAQSPSEPMTKAHKILGSTNISIDNLSSTSLVIPPSEGNAPRGVHGSRRNAAGAEALLKELDQEWSDGSSAAPRYLGVEDGRLHVSDPSVSDPSAVLRQQPSSSTIRSWSDRSQQTSAASNPKGRSNKAERLLDMDNALSVSKNKKKPTKLDLSRLKPLGRARKGSDWEDAAHGGEIKRSPSAMSPRALQKRPTHEHLRPAADPEPVRPTTSGPSRPRNHHKEHMNELPNLYKHYEQMSFAQILGEELEAPENRSNSRSTSRGEVLAELPGDTYIRNKSRNGKQKEGADHSPTSPIEHGHFTQVVRAPTPTKAEEQQSSPTSYAASVSSRHTRTSKASKRTETSFQMADLQEKSVLMLSSDSEEDDDDLYAGSPVRRRNPSPPITRPLSTASNSGASSYEGGMAKASGREGYDPSARQSNSTVRNMSTTSDDFLGIPSNRLGKTSALLSPSNSSLGSSHWGATFHLPATPSTLSIASESNQASTRVWHESTSGSESFDARSLVTQAASTLASRESQQDWNDRSYFDSRYSGTTSGRGSRPSGRPQSSQPTPPLSPSSVDFFIQSARTSLDTKNSPSESALSLTRQEQVLITALRQRREDMRKSNLLADDRLPSSRHQPKPSEATITDQSFRSDFPPSVSASSARLSSLRASGSIASSLNLPISGVRESDADNESMFTTDSPVFLLSPPPASRYKPITIPTSLARIDTERMTPLDDQMVMYLDSPAGPALTISEGTMSPEASRFEDLNSSIDEAAPGSPQSSPISPRTKRNSVRPQQVSIKIGHSEKMWPVVSPLLPPQRELPPLPTKRRQISIAEEEDDDEEEEGVPRPDSPVDCPISPMAKQFPELPKDRQTARNQTARLSAFGPPSPTQAGWWGDED